MTKPGCGVSSELHALQYVLPNLWWDMFIFAVMTLCWLKAKIPPWDTSYLIGTHTQSFFSHILKNWDKLCYTFSDRKCFLFSFSSLLLDVQCFNVMAEVSNILKVEGFEKDGEKKSKGHLWKHNRNDFSLPASLFQTARTRKMKALKVAAKKPLQ